MDFFVKYTEVFVNEKRTSTKKPVAAAAPVWSSQGAPSGQRMRLCATQSGSRKDRFVN